MTDRQEFLKQINSFDEDQDLDLKKSNSFQAILTKADIFPGQISNLKSAEQSPQECPNCKRLKKTNKHLKLKLRALANAPDLNSSSEDGLRKMISTLQEKNRLLTEKLEQIKHAQQLNHRLRQRKASPRTIMRSASPNRHENCKKPNWIKHF